MKSIGLLIGLFFLIVSNAFAYTSQDYYSTGVKFYQQGQYENAIKYLKSSVQMDPQNWLAYQVLGQSYYQLNKTDEALKAFDQSLRIHPDNPTIKKFKEALKTNTGGSPASAPSADDPPAVGLTGGRGQQAVSQFNAGWDLQQKSVEALKRYGMDHPLTAEESDIVKYGEPSTAYSIPKVSVALGLFTPSVWSLDLGFFIDPTTNIGINFGYTPNGEDEFLLYLDPRIKFYSQPSGLNTFTGFGIIYYDYNPGLYNGNSFDIIAPNFIFGFRSLPKDGLFTFEMDCEVGLAILSESTMTYTYNYNGSGNYSGPQVSSSTTITPFPFLFPEIRFGLSF